MDEFNAELTIDDHTYRILLRVEQDILISQDLLIDFLNLIELMIKSEKIVVSPTGVNACK